MKGILPFVLLGSLLVIIRLYLNFFFDLIPGINGGYYPLQVRSVVETGKLGFPDMPLYFYLSAFFVKVVGWFSDLPADELILKTVKAIDSFSLPLLIVPLYLMKDHLVKNRLSKLAGFALLVFATLSFSPLALTSDLQKNALAIPLMMFFIHFLLLFLINRRRKHLLFSLVFIILTALTHYGTFSVAILLLVILIIVIFGKRAVFPALLVLGISIILVFIFDKGRAERLVELPALMFERPWIVQGRMAPFDLITFLVSWVISGMGIYKLAQRNFDRSDSSDAFLPAFIILNLILSFPLLDGEFAKRFGLMLFIPQLILLYLLFPLMNRKVVRMISILLISISVISAILVTLRPKPPVITTEAFKDLENLKPFILEPANTLIIARHGLEWWTAWQLKTKVGQDKAVNENVFEKYEKVIILRQTGGKIQTRPGRKDHFHEPEFPGQQSPFYRSSYFHASVLVNFRDY